MQNKFGFFRYTIIFLKWLFKIVTKFWNFVSLEICANNFHDSLRYKAFGHGKMFKMKSKLYWEMKLIQFVPSIGKNTEFERNMMKTVF